MLSPCRSHEGVWSSTICLDCLSYCVSKSILGVICIWLNPLLYNPFKYIVYRWLCSWGFESPFTSIPSTIFNESGFGVMRSHSVSGEVFWSLRSVCLVFPRSSPVATLLFWTRFLFAVEDISFVSLSISESREFSSLSGSFEIFLATLPKSPITFHSMVEID